MWKSDDRGSREATFIQLGRRGGEAERHGKTLRGGEVERCRDRDRQSHIHVQWIKNRKDASEVRDPSPSPDHWAQGSSIKKISPYNIWRCKPVGVGMVKETVGISRNSS